MFDSLQQRVAVQRPQVGKMPTAPLRTRCMLQKACALCVHNHQIGARYACNSQSSACSRLRLICHAGDEREPVNELSDQDSEVLIQGSDTEFLFKLLLISIGGAVFIKYGSLVLDAPFHPDAGLGLVLVIGPCLIYSIALLYKSRQETTE